MKMLAIALALLPAAGATQPGYSIVSRSCSASGTLVDLSTGKTVPSGDSDYRTTGHVLRWTAGNATFTLSTGQLLRAGNTLPQLVLDREDDSPGATGSQSKQSHHSLSFYSIEGAGTQSMIVDRGELVTKKSDSESVVSDLETDPAKRYPDDDVVTTKSAGSTRSVSTSTAPQPVNQGYQYKTFKNDCTEKPAKLADLQFSGFFEHVKAKIQSFDGKFNTAKTANDALTACLAKNTPCVAEKAAAGTATAARDTLWNSLLKASDLVATPPAPPPVDNGPDQPDGHDCTWSSDCFNGQACQNHVCVAPTCQWIHDCNSGQSCVNGACADNGGPGGCSTDMDCSGTERCMRGVCTGDSSHGGCGTDSDCAGGQRCQNHACESDPFARSCFSDTDCPSGRCSSGYCQ